MKTISLLLAAAWITQDGEVARVLEKHRAARPAESEIRIYRLSWMATLKEARERAAKEDRPIFLMVCTNSYGNLFTGHC